MTRKGRNFELSYKWLYDLDKDKYVVTSPAYLYDRASKGKREIDVLVEYSDNEGIRRKIGIECRDRKSVVDVTGIEQLKQKKEDLGLDYLVITTTKRFTDGAINKAKYYGVIIEQAEMINSSNFDLYAKEYYVDFFFYKFELIKLDILTKDKEQYKFKEYLMKLNMIEQNIFLKYINLEFFLSFQPNELLKNDEFNMEIFFENINNIMELEGRDIIEQEVVPDCMKNVFAIAWKVQVIPYKISLPICESISVFEGETHKNKNYRVRYGDDLEYLEIGYLDGKSFTYLSIQPRKYLRFAGAHIELNTIFPKGIEMATPDVNYIVENFTGEFDISKIN